MASPMDTFTELAMAIVGGVESPTPATPLRSEWLRVMRSDAESGQQGQDVGVVLRSHWEELMDKRVKVCECMMRSPETPSPNAMALCWRRITHSKQLLRFLQVAAFLSSGSSCEACILFGGFDLIPVSCDPMRIGTTRSRCQEWC
ncbi:hypothetical protein AAG906_001586 [Vitis piasezkii]